MSPELPPLRQSAQLSSNSTQIFTAKTLVNSPENLIPAL